MNPWNGGLRLGLLSWSWSLGQKPGCSHTAFVCPASGSNARGLVDSKLGRGEAWGLWRSLSAELGHYLKGTVGEPEQIGIRYS